VKRSHRHPRPGELQGVWVKNLPSGQRCVGFQSPLQALLSRKKDHARPTSRCPMERGVAFAYGDPGGCAS